MAEAERGPSPPERAQVSGALARSRAPRGATKQERIGRPTSERIGMFWRFGFVLDNRPVVVATWLSASATVGAVASAFTPIEEFGK